MTTYSATRHFRKAALCTVFALAASASTSASAQAVQVHIKNDNSNVKGVWIQNENNPNGWACIPVKSPGESDGPAILYNYYYSVYALSSTDCTGGGQRINNLSSHYYKVPNKNITSTTIHITNTMLNIYP